MGIEFQQFRVAYLGDDGPLPPALDGIDLLIPDGQTVLLTGPSGCGKTTALRSINGLVPGFHEAQTHGGVLVEGSPVAQYTTAELASRVGYVFQDPRSEFFTFDVRSELAFPCENAGIEPAEITRRIDETAAAVGLEHLLGRGLARLSSGEKQKVAIGAALMMRPRILLFDEPSANLDTEALAMLTGVIGSLRTRGVTVVVADHRLGYLDGVLDRVVVMDHGRVVTDLGADDIAARDAQWFTDRGLRRLHPPALESRPCTGPIPDGGLHIASARFAHPGHDVLWSIDDLHLPARGVVGVTGANGCGKTTLVRFVLGLLACRGARVRLGGADWPRRRRTRQCAYVMQDVEYQLLGESVRAELLIGPEPGERTRRRADELLARMGLDALAGQHPLTLSGGQKQRVGIALACMKQAPVICLDEPTSGLDAAAMRALSGLLRQVAEDGALVLVITHDTEFAAETFDHVIRIGDRRMRLEAVTCGPHGGTRQPSTERRHP